MRSKVARWLIVLYLLSFELLYVSTSVGLWG